MADWLNSFYTDEVLFEARKQFVECKNFSLLQFLSRKGLSTFANLKWKREFEPLRWRYSFAVPPKFIRSDEFLSVLSKVVGRKVKFDWVAVAKFSKGDYSVLYDKLKPCKGFVFFLDVDVSALDRLDGSNGWSESLGGYSSFVKNSKEVVRVVPKHNVLFVIDARGLRFFTKYVNHHALRDRVCVGGVVLPK